MNQNIRDGGNTMKIIDNVTAFSEDKYLSDKGYGEFKFAGTITVTGVIWLNSDKNQNELISLKNRILEKIKCLEDLDSIEVLEITIYDRPMLINAIKTNQL